MLRELNSFWQRTGLLARSSVVVAGLAAVVNVLAIAGVTFEGPLRSVYALHIAVMALGSCLFFRLAFTFRRRVWQSDGGAWSRHLLVVTVLVAFYFGALFLGIGAHYGEGGPELRDGAYVWLVRGEVIRPMTAHQYASYQANLAMVFSAGWLFFALVTAMAHGRCDARGTKTRVPLFVRPNER